MDMKALKKQERLEGMIREIEQIFKKCCSEKNLNLVKKPNLQSDQMMFSHLP